MFRSQAIRIVEFIRRVIGIPRREAAIRESRAAFPVSPSRSENAASNGCIQQPQDGNLRLSVVAMPLIGGAVTQDEVLQFCDLLSPWTVDGFKKIRVGNANDGGYVFVDDFAAVSAVISCGISNDVTCDLAFAEMGKPVLQFDHTVSGPPVDHPNFRFYKKAIGTGESSRSAIRLWDVVIGEGDNRECDLLLKIDIDGDEWETFAAFPPEQLKRLRQISCEFHWSSKMGDAEYFATCMRAVRNIRSHFFPVHMHANNFVGFANLMGVPVPEVYEVTFANAAIYKPSMRGIKPNSGLDNPNNPDVPDLYLGSPFKIYGM